MNEALETMTFHIDDGTMQEIQRQIQEQMEAHRGLIESIHMDMAPFHEQIEALHAQLEPLREQLIELSHEERAQIREQMMQDREAMEIEREELERMHEEMDRVHREMEPLHEEMERMGERVEAAMQDDVAAVIRSHLGPVTSPEAEFGEAAARIIDEAQVHIDDDILELDVSSREVREILRVLFEPLKIGTEEAFDEAIEGAAEALADLEIRTE
jgi:chromosome segregation ATPase